MLVTFVPVAVLLGISATGKSNNATGLLTALVCSWVAFLPGELVVILSDTMSKAPKGTPQKFGILLLEVMKALILPFVWMGCLLFFRSLGA